VTIEYFKCLKMYGIDFVKPESEATIHEVIENPDIDHECVGSIVLYHILNTDSSDGNFLSAFSIKMHTFRGGGGGSCEKLSH
jgi:hypothetical protein